MYLYGSRTGPRGDPRFEAPSSHALERSDALREDEIKSSSSVFPVNRHLLSAEVGNGSEILGDDSDSDNCTKLRDHHGYNDTCEFVRNNCQDEGQLFNYLGFVTCQMKDLQVGSHLPLFTNNKRCFLSLCFQPLAYVILAVWLVYLISLLATTVSGCYYIYCSSCFKAVEV